MTFKIISVGWQCAQFLERTLESVEAQTRDDWEIMVVYDKSTDDGVEKIVKWYDDHDPMKWHYQINPDQKFAVRNQWEGIAHLNPEDDDIIVFLDLDGDQLAHPLVLEHLAEYYADDTLVTYGNYQPVPFADTCPLAIPYPPEVVANRTYRDHILNFNGCCFNHLRTIKGKVWRAIPEDRFKRPNGEWYESGTDYVMMVPALELADGRYKCIEETLLLYNNANPLADYLTHPAETSGNIKDALERPALPRL